MEWAITALFYSAFHHTEGYVAKFGVHSRDHADRAKEISRDPRLRLMFAYYRVANTQHGGTLHNTRFLRTRLFYSCQASLRKDKGGNEVIRKELESTWSLYCPTWAFGVHLASNSPHLKSFVIS